MSGTTQRNVQPSPDLLSIARLVPKGSRVLDLGCGDGALLDHLQRERGCSGYGIEIADENVLACVKRGVNVIQANLDQGLSIFDDDAFDVVLQIDTLQHLRNAETMLRETARVGRTGTTPSCSTIRVIWVLCAPISRALQHRESAKLRRARARVWGPKNERRPDPAIHRPPRAEGRAGA